MTVKSIRENFPHIFKCGQVFIDETSAPYFVRHTIVSIQRSYSRYPTILRFDTGLVVGELPYDDNWRLRWTDFIKFFTQEKEV